MTLGPCPSCDRHVRLPSPTCPFCGAVATGAVAGLLRPVTRRELTRAAIFAGAALIVGCGSADERETETTDDRTSGGDDTTFTDDEEEDTREVWIADADAGTDAGLPDAGLPDAGVDQQQLLFDPEDDPRRHRQLPRCVTEGTCPAPPYGAPPADVTIV
ncbi:MAG: hypothetical protein H6719_32080 [Sandaracinaceae bacterium]|nr:hypothetical protein [Sandaracinaceae bacterium]